MIVTYRTFRTTHARIVKTFLKKEDNKETNKELIIITKVTNQSLFLVSDRIVYIECHRESTDY